MASQISGAKTIETSEGEGGKRAKQRGRSSLDPQGTALEGQGRKSGIADGRGGTRTGGWRGWKRGMEKRDRGPCNRVVETGSVLLVETQGEETPMVWCWFPTA